MLTTAISSGFATGIGAIGLKGTAGEIADAMLRAGEANIFEQLAEAKLGLAKQGFNLGLFFRSFLASIASAGVNNRVGTALTNVGQVGTAFVESITGDLASDVVMNHYDLRNLGIDAIGSTIGTVAAQEASKAIGDVVPAYYMAGLNAEVNDLNNQIKAAQGGKVDAAKIGHLEQQRASIMATIQAMTTNESLPVSDPRRSVPAAANDAVYPEASVKAKSVMTESGFVLDASAVDDPYDLSQQAWMGRSGANGNVSLSSNNSVQKNFSSTAGAFAGLGLVSTPKIAGDFEQESVSTVLGKQSGLAFLESMEKVGDNIHLPDFVESTKVSSLTQFENTLFFDGKSFGIMSSRADTLLTEITRTPYVPSFFTKTGMEVLGNAGRFGTGLEVGNAAYQVGKAVVTHGDVGHTAIHVGGELGAGYAGRAAGFFAASRGLAMAGAALEFEPGLGTIIGTGMIVAGGVGAALAVGFEHFEPTIDGDYDRFKNFIRS